MSYIEMGSFGAVEPAAVKALQQRMINEGLLAGKADGIAGPATFNAAVKWVEASIKLVEGALPAIAASGVMKVFATLTSRVKGIKEALPAAVKSGNPTKLAALQTQLLAMFLTAKNDAGQKVDEKARTFLSVNLAVLGTSSALAVRQAPITTGPTEPIAPAPVTVSSTFPVVPVLGGLAALLLVGAMMGGGKKARRNPEKPLRRLSPEARARMLAFHARRRAARRAVA